MVANEVKGIMLNALEKRGGETPSHTRQGLSEVIKA